MPDVFADEHARPPESGLEAAEAITRRKVPLLVEHAVGREVDLAVDVHQLAAAEVEAGIEVAMIRGLDPRTEHHVQPPRERAELLHDRALPPDPAFGDQVLAAIAG